MVDLNRLFSRGQINTRTRTPSLASSDGGGRGIAAIGAGISNVAQQFSRELKKEETLNSVSNNNRDYKVQMNEMDTQLKAEFGDDLEGYQEAFGVQSKGLRDQMMETSPNSDAKNAFFASSNTIMTNKMVGAQDYVTKQKLGKIVKGFGTSLESMTMNLRQTGNAPEGIQDLNEFKAQVEASTALSPLQKDSINKKAPAFMAKGYADMFLEKEMYDEGLKFLDGGGEFSTSLTSSQKTSLTLRYNQGKDRKDRENFSTLNQNITLAVESVKGGTQSPEVLDNIFKQVETLPMEETKRDALKGKLVVAKVSKEISDTIALVPPSKRGGMDIDQGLDKTIKDFQVRNPLMASAVKAESAKGIKKFVAGLQRELEADPVTYFATRDKKLSDLSKQAVSGDPESFSKYKTKLDSYYDEFGIAQGDRKYMTEPMKDFFKGNITGFVEEGKFKQAAATLEKIEKMAGPDRFSVLQDLDMADYAVLGEVSDSSGKVRALKNMDKEFQKTMKSQSTLDKDDTRSTLVDHPNYRAYNLQGGRSSQSNQNSEEILKHVEREYTRLRVEQGRDEESAINGAWGMFNKDFNVIDSGKNSMMVPRKKETLVKGFVEHQDLNWGQSFKDLNIAKDPRISVEEHVQDLTDNHSWVTNKDKTGIQLFIKRGTQLTRVQDKEGQDIVRTFDQIDEANFTPLDSKTKMLNIFKVKKDTKEQIKRNLPKF